MRGQRQQIDDGAIGASNEELVALDKGTRGLGLPVELIDAHGVCRLRVEGRRTERLATGHVEERLGRVAVATGAVGVAQVEARGGLDCHRWARP